MLDGIHSPCWPLLWMESVWIPSTGITVPSGFLLGSSMGSSGRLAGGESQGFIPLSSFLKGHLHLAESLESFQGAIFIELSTLLGSGNHFLLKSL